MNDPNANSFPTRTVAPSSMSLATPSNPETVGDPALAAHAIPARIGEYVLLGELGHGGMGVVYRAEDPRLKREVALKVMLPQLAANPQAKARFVREARAQAKVEHDHVAAIHQVNDHDGLPYIVMPLLKGMTLQAALKANPRPPLAEVIRIGRETAEGLAAAHEKGLVHRDIKPANVWLEGKKLRVKVLDFGLARVSDTDADTEGTDGPVTREGAVVGTPAYMSPEQGRGLPVDGRTDLFSLGVMLYQMTTGELPFRGSTTLAILTALAVDNPPPPITRNPAVPPQLSDFVMRLLAKDPAYRPPTAEIAAEELRAIESGLVNAVRVIPLDAPPPIILAQEGPDPFAELDATEVNSIPDAESVEVDDANEPVARREPPKPSRGFPMWAMVAVVLLAVAGVVGFVASQMGRKPEAVVKEEPPAPRPTTTSKPRDTTDPVKKAVAWVLANGGEAASGMEGSYQSVTSPDTIPGPILAVSVSVATVDDAALENLRALPALTNLSLRLAPITDAGMKSLAGMPFAKTLTSLDLSGSSPTDAGLESLTTFANLEYLAVAGKFTPEGLAKIRKLTKLKRLVFGYSVLTDAHLTGLKELPLTYLYLGYNSELTGAGLANLGQMLSLTGLGYPGIAMKDEDVKAFVRAMPNLSTLSLASSGPLCPLTNEGLAHFRGSRVRLLDIGASALTAKTVTPLPRCEIRVNGMTIAEPTDAPFREASRLLARGGMAVGVRLATGGDEIYVKTAAELPDAPFTLTRVSIVGPSSVPFSDADLKRLEATPTLVTLELTGASITDEGFRSALASKDTLTLTYLHSCPLTDKSLATLGELPNLVSIAIGGWQVTDDGVKHLAGLKKLHTAGIGTTPLTDACLKYLTGLPLKRLILDDSAISDAGVETLSKLKGLDELALMGTLVTEAGYKKLKEALPKCMIVWEEPNRYVAKMLLTRPDQGQMKVELVLPGGKLVTVEKVEDLPAGPFTFVGFYRHGGPNALSNAELRALESTSTLKSVFFPHLVISPTGLRALLPSKNTLSNLYLVQSKLTDEHLKVIAELTAITSLNLSATESGITDSGLVHLAGLAQLDALFLDELAITDAGLKHLTSLPALTSLGVAKTAVSDAGIESLVKMKGLRALNITGTRITRAGFERLQKELPDCKIVWEDPNRWVAKLFLERAPFVNGVGGFLFELKLPDGKTVTAVKAADLPAGPFTIVGLTRAGPQPPALTDADMKRLEVVPTLTGFSAHGLAIGVDGLRSLLALKKSLTGLAVGAVSDEHLKLIGELTELTGLQFGGPGTKVTDDGIAHLAGLTKLLVLVMDDTSITDAGLKKLLGGLPSLSVLSLTNSVVSDDSVPSIANMKMLTRLHLVGTRITEAGYKKLQAALPNCKIEWEQTKAALAEQTPQTRAALKAVLASGGKLVVLIGEETRTIGPKDSLPAGPFVVRDVALTAPIVGELQDLPAVTGTLRVEFTEFNDEGLARLASIPGLASITQFGLGASAVTGPGLRVLRQFPELTWVSVAYCQKVEGDLSPLAELSKLKKLSFLATSADRASLASIAKIKLDTLAISECKIDDAALAELVGMGSLREFAAGRNASVTEAGLKKLALSLPSCRIVYGDANEKVIEPTKKP